MSFDTAYQNTGLSEGVGALPRRLRTAPQSSLPFEKGRRTPTLNFTCGALPHTPTLAVWQEGEANSFPLCEGSVSLHSVKGRVVFF